MLCQIQAEENTTAIQSHKPQNQKTMQLLFLYTNSSQFLQWKRLILHCAQQTEIPRRLITFTHLAASPSGVCYGFTVPWCIWSVHRCSSALHHFQHPSHFWLHRIWHRLSYSSMSSLHPSTSPVSTIMIQNENTLPTFSVHFASSPWSSSYMDPKLLPHFQF